MPPNMHFRRPPVADLMPIPNSGVHVRKGVITLARCGSSPHLQILYRR